MLMVDSRDSLKFAARSMDLAMPCCTGSSRWFFGTYSVAVIASDGGFNYTLHVVFAPSKRQAASNIE
jgi:hypothetical protein